MDLLPIAGIYPALIVVCIRARLARAVPAPLNLFQAGSVFLIKEAN